MVSNKRGFRLMAIRPLIIPTQYATKKSKQKKQKWQLKTTT